MLEYSGMFRLLLTPFKRMFAGRDERWNSLRFLQFNLTKLTVMLPQIDLNTNEMTMFEL